MDLHQTARMRKLVWIHIGRKPIMLVLSWRGSYIVFGNLVSVLEIKVFFIFFSVLRLNKSVVITVPHSAVCSSGHSSTEELSIA
jgi:hypothetical protein